MRSPIRLHQYILKIKKIKISGNTDLIDLSGALGSLSAMLRKHYGIAPILIIDEYDTPIQQGYMYGFYDEAILFMRNFFSEGLKDNNDLGFGFLTGIMRVAKESIFSGMNNLSVNSVLDNKYSCYLSLLVLSIADKYRTSCFN
ncbi:AAA family ATPase [Ruminococcus albus]